MISRTQGEAILARLPEFGNTITDYELNCEGADENDLKGTLGYVGKLHELDVPVFRAYVESLPYVKVISFDEINGINKAKANDKSE